MTAATAYGSRPDLLPRSLVRMGRTAGSGTTWVGQQGVEVLSFAEHTSVERAALRQFARRSDGTIRWDEHPGSVLSSASADSAHLAEEVAALAELVDSLVIMWGSLAMPSVRVTAGVARDVAPELSTPAATEMWIIAEPLQILVEYSYFHDSLVVARVPASD